MNNFFSYDLLGQPVHVDDLIVYAFTYGNSVEMRIGRIIDFVITPGTSNHYLKVDWKVTTAYSVPDKPTKIRVQPGRKENFLKVELDGFN